MENIDLYVNDQNQLVITCDLTVPGSKSGSGKSMVIASTRGNAKVPETEFTLGLNLYRKV